MALVSGHPQALVVKTATLLFVCSLFIPTCVYGQQGLLGEDFPNIFGQQLDDDNNNTQTTGGVYNNTQTTGYGYNNTQTTGGGNQPDTGLSSIFNIIAQSGIVNTVVRRLMSNLTSNLGTFTNVAKDINLECLSHFSTVYQGLTGTEQWALRMIDAFGKPHAGLLDGNFMWLGSYDECIGVVAPVPKNSTEQGPLFKGKYCLAQMEVAKPSATIPTGANIRLGICIPSTCTSKDMNALVSIGLLAIPQLPKDSEAKIDCKKEHKELDSTAEAVIVVCCIFGGVMLLGTLYDVIIVQRRKPAQQELVSTAGKFFHADNTKPNSDASKTQRLNSLKQSTFETVLLSFSIYSNGCKILNTNQPACSLTAVNGIRFLSMSWVILGHTYSFVFGYTENMLSFYSKSFKDFSIQAVANATFSVDSFFVLSGLLVSYLSLKQLKKVGGATRFPWAMYYFHRFWRLTPPYMLVMMVYTPLYQYWGTGPLYPEDSIDGIMCRKYWWRNLLYINNFFSMNESCMGWSWYLANDMQFYVLSPLMLIPLYYSGIIGGIVCLGFFGISFATSGILTAQKELPPSFMFSQKSDYVDAIYVKPYARIGSYVVGIVAGYILYRSNCKLRIPKLVNLFFWCVATATALACLYGLYDIGGANLQNPLSLKISAVYNAFSRTAWSIAVAWVIVACATGNGGFVNTLLSWSPFVPLGRLTYCAYLIHPLIIFWFNQNEHTMIDTKHLVLIYQNLGNLVMSYGVAFAVSLAFESPMMGLEKALLKKGK